MITAGEIVQEVSKYLVDQERDFEYEHWTEAELLTYLRDALRILSMNFKGQYTTTQRVPAAAGSAQPLPADCGEFVSVLAQVNAKGGVVSYLRRASSGTIGVLGAAACAVKGVFKARTYQQDSSNKGVVWIEPPVPDGDKSFFGVQCVCTPKVDSPESVLQIPDQHIPIIKELMLYYAYGVDQESVTSRQYADTHWKNAAALIGVERATPSVNNADPIKRE